MCVGCYGNEASQSVATHELSHQLSVVLSHSNHAQLQHYTLSSRKLHSFRYCNNLVYSIVDQQEQQRVAVGHGNAQFMAIRQVSLRRPPLHATSALLLQLIAAADVAAVIQQFTD